VIVLPPVALATAMLVQSSVAENDYAEWSATKTYAKGDRCIRGAVHRIFESAAAGNTGHDPATDTTGAWINIGPTNAWAMFDEAVGTATTAPGSITVTLAPGAVGMLAVLDTNAETVRVVVATGGASLYDMTQATNKSGGVIADWYDYFTAPIGKVSTLIFDSLPLYANAQITVTLTGPDPKLPVNVGTLMVGSPVDLGLLEAEPTVSILDFSTKTTDNFGVTSVVQRPFSKQMQVKSLIDTAAVDGVQRAVAGLRARPALWIAEEGFDALAIYGFFKDFSINLSTETVSYVSLTVEGLT
jgi:hypothetical protein